MTDNIWSRFSPDGSKVAHYQRRIIDEKAYEAFVVQGIDGGDPIEFLRFSRLNSDLKVVPDDLPYPFYWTPMRCLCWSPDGSRIAVCLDNGKWRSATRASGQMRFVIMIVTLDGRVEKAWDLKELGIAFPGTLDWR